jgi:ribosomal protein S19
MLMSDSLEVSIADVACSQAKISLAPRTVQKEVEDGKDENGKILKKKEPTLNINFSNPYYVIPRYMKYIHYFNSITEFQTRIMGKEFSEIQILNEFIPFVTPLTVRYVPSLYWSTDLLKRDSSNGDGLDYEEFIRLSNHIRRWFKKDASSETTSLASIKVHKSLADVLPCVVYKKQVSYDDKAFVPLEIYDAALGHLFDADYFNAKAIKVLTQFIAEMKF